MKTHHPSLGNVYQQQKGASRGGFSAQKVKKLVFSGQNMPFPRHSHAAFLHADGKIRVYGGIESNIVHEKTVMIMDTTTGNWTTSAVVASLAISSGRSRFNAYCKLNDGRVLGATQGVVSPYATMEIYDPTADTWTATADVPNNGGDYAGYPPLLVLLLSGKVLAIGGLATGNIPNTQFNIWDPGSGLWTTKTQVLTMGNQNGAAWLMPDGFIHIHTQSSSSTWIYDEIGDTLVAGPGAVMSQGGGIGSRPPMQNGSKYMNYDRQSSFSAPILNYFNGISSTAVTPSLFTTESACVGVETSRGYAVFRGVRYNPDDGTVGIDPGIWKNPWDGTTQKTWVGLNAVGFPALVEDTQKRLWTIGGYFDPAKIPTNKTEYLVL